MKANPASSIAAVILAVALGGCSTWNGWFQHKGDASASAPAAATSEAPPAKSVSQSAVAPVPARAAAPDMAAMSVAEAQAKLTALGYDCGKADGVIGRKTRTQLKRFQKSKGLSVSGKLDEATIAALRAP
jgi:peptidoglycan hydrolase-like protein with peptidoglycan-binding domain